MNRKGFTLVELLSTLVILGLLVSIGGVAITKTINNSKQKNYETVIANIKNGTEAFYQECKYGGDATGVTSECFKSGDDGYYSVKVSVLLTYGYITPNSSEGNVNKLVNPKNEDYDFADCTIYYKYNDSQYKLIVTTPNQIPDGRCPHASDFEG